MTIHIVDGDLPHAYIAAAEKATIIGVDIETSGLNRHRDAIACVQVHVPQFGTVMVRKLDDKVTNLKQLMRSYRVTKVFQYGEFDLAFLLRDYPSMRPAKICDTKIAAKILDPKREKFKHPDTGDGSHSLIALVWHYFGYKMNKQLAVSNWFVDDLTPAQLEYAAKDVEYLPELLRNLERDIFAKDPRLVQDLVHKYDGVISSALISLKEAA